MSLPPSRRFLVSTLTCIIILIFCGAVLAQVSTDPSVVGNWSHVYTWPEVAVHMAVLPDGRLITFTDPQWNDSLSTPAGAWVVPVPAMGVPGTGTYVPPGTDDIWCAGQAFLSDGRLLVVGGAINGVSGPGTNTYDLFDWNTTGWTPGPAMNFSRWYPTATTLSTGDVLVLSGSEDSNYNNANIPEVTTSQGSGRWKKLTSAVLNLTLYPRSFLAPNGKVFVAAGGSPPGANQMTYYLDTSGTGSWSTVGNSRYGNRFNGTAAMYDTGKILIAGGTNNFSVTPAT